MLRWLRGIKQRREREGKLHVLLCKMLKFCTRNKWSWLLERDSSYVHTRVLSVANNRGFPRLPAYWSCLSRRALAISRNKIIVNAVYEECQKWDPRNLDAGHALVVQEFHLGRNTALQVSRETDYCSAFLIVGQMSSAKAILWKKTVGVRRL